MLRIWVVFGVISLPWVSFRLISADISVSIHAVAIVILGKSIDCKLKSPWYPIQIFSELSLET